MLNSSNYSFKPFAVSLGFFFTSLNILGWAFGVILAGRPLLGRVAEVLNHLHLETVILLWTDKYLKSLRFITLCKSTILDLKSSEISFFARQHVHQQIPLIYSKPKMCFFVGQTLTSTT